MYAIRSYYGAQDASRTNPEYLDEMVNHAISLGADRIRLADTVGVMNPLSVQELFGRYASFDIPFEFHAHNRITSYNVCYTKLLRA